MGNKDKKDKEKNKAANLLERDDSPESSAAGSSEFVMPGTVRKKRRKGWIVAVAILLVLVVLFAASRALSMRRMSVTSGTYTPYTVERGDITVTLSGSGTLQPADSYTITSLISGDILSAPFEEGDMVQKDQTLYTIDSSDADSSVKQAENNLKDSQQKYQDALKQLDNLKVKAGGAGTLIQLNVEKGDTVQAGEVLAVIRNSDVMSVKVLFQKGAADGFYIGESADVTLAGSFQTYTGTVSNISSDTQVLTGNVIAKEVTIDVTNPGAISTDSSAYASIAGISSLQNGAFSYKYESNVTATASGTVSTLEVAQGSRVSKGQVIAVLQSDSVDQQIQTAQSAVNNAKLALDTQNNKMSGYTIKSPIAGTIVEKDYKEGDTMKAGEVLCTVFDLSHLTLTLNVDELDIKKVQPGQTVTITADAIQGTEFTGTVSKVNIKGTTKNGVTSYPVTIQIDQTEGLLPGMNVDAKIVVESMQDVLTVPVGAVLRNNFVLLKSGDAGQKASEPGIPAGFAYTEVTLGPANDTDIVITGGLKEGDIVAVMDTTPTAYDYNPFERGQGGETSTENDSSGEGSSQGQSAQTAAGVSG